MTTTVDGVYADVVLLYKLLNFFDKNVIILKNNILICFCWALVESWLWPKPLCKSIESAIHWFQIYPRIVFAIIQNSVIYRLGARVSTSLALVPTTRIMWLMMKQSKLWYMATVCLPSIPYSSNYQVLLTLSFKNI